MWRRGKGVKDQSVQVGKSQMAEISSAMRKATWNAFCGISFVITTILYVNYSNPDYDLK